MHKNQDHVAQARSLRADILAAPHVWLPRREILLEWLDGFLRRAGSSAYELEPTEAADLHALDQFLRRQKIPAV